MKSGEILKQTFKVDPGENGSFMIYTGNYESSRPGRTIGFSTADDLLKFLSNERDALQDEKPQPPKTAMAS